MVPETSSAISQNLRFPGQYFDAETNLHQNYFRDYNPKLECRMHSYPIKLKGGINLWGYTENRPTIGLDYQGKYFFPIRPSFGCSSWTCSLARQDNVA